MLRRHGSNIGDEDEILENNVEIDEDNDAAEDGTIMRNTKPKTNLKKFHRSSSRVNGTSETINKQSSSNNFTSSNNKNQDPNSSFRVQKFLEKGKASLSRSKSELGEQHKKMISHLSKRGNDLTEQNKKLLANLSSRKLIPGGGGGERSNNSSAVPNISKNGGKIQTDLDEKHHVVGEKSLQNGGGICIENGGKIQTDPIIGSDQHADLPKDLDGVIQNLGFDMRSSSSNIENGGKIQTGLAKKKRKTLEGKDNQISSTNGSMSQSMYVNNGIINGSTVQPPNYSTATAVPWKMENGGKIQITDQQSSNNMLERHLENDYGEFEFIDEAGTLTRTLKTNGESVNCDEHRKSMFSFSDEIFDELEKSGTLKMENNGGKIQIAEQSALQQLLLPQQQQQQLTASSSSQLQQQENTIIKQQQIKRPESAGNNKDFYETYGAWRQRKYSGTGSSTGISSSSTGSSGYVSQYYSYQNNNNMTPNNCTSANNTSAKLSALIADQTLLLRHHKRRQQKQQHSTSWREIQNNQCEDQENQLQSLIDLQQQLTKTKEHLLETQICQQQNNQVDFHHQIQNGGGKIQIQGSSNTEGASTSSSLFEGGGGLHPLRRCSSLSHTDAIGLYSSDHHLHQLTTSCQTGNSPPPPPQKINGTSSISTKNNHQHHHPAQQQNLSSNSPWLSSTTTTSPSNNGSGSSSSRYLYRGKFQPTATKSSSTGGVPTSTTSNNNNSYNKKKNSPWQLRGNLSSFARRRRGSSTSLHNFSDDEEMAAGNSNGTTVQDTNNCKQTAVDSISLADSAEVLSMNHR